jgi:catechol 2,3-dioxygenase-like lactoylglutathione lyase family enzyme
LRIYDANLGAWRILWSDPLKHYYARQIGRAHGGDIVQEGKTDQGALTRWSFTEITPASFRWRGEHSRDAGASWQLQADIHACRAASQGKFTRSQAMLDHVSIGVRDIARAKKFYDCALQPLGYGCLSEGESSLGYGADVVGFWVSAADSPVPSDPGSGLHICFRAPTRQSVDDFYAAARASGGADNGRPGLRADYGDNYYAAFVVDPDGYRLEAYCSAPVK